MAYTKWFTDWLDAPSTATPIDQAALDHIETGVFDSAAAADTANSAAVTAQGTADLAVPKAATVVSGWGFILDEDAMGSDSATKLATQQSIKAYADSAQTAAEVTAAGALSTHSGDGTGIHGIADTSDLLVTADITDMVETSSTSVVGWSFVLDEDNMAADSATKVPTQQSVKAYVDNSIGGSSFTDDVFRVQDGGDNTKQLALQLLGLTTATTRTLTVPDADGTIALVGDVTAHDSDTTSVHGIADTSVLVVDSDITDMVETSSTSVVGWGFVLDEDNMATDSASKVPTQQSVKAYVDAQVAGGGGTVFDDDIFRVQDQTDNSKKLAFELSGVATSTTRTLTVPNADGTVALVGDVTAHDSDTTSVHGIADTSVLVVDSDIAAMVKTTSTSVIGWAFVVDQDNMASNSASKVPTQQSVKAYVDAQVEFVDTTFRLQDGADPTKQLAFELSGIGTGTTRTLTVPNSSGTVALTSDVSTHATDATSVHGLTDGGDVQALYDALVALASGIIPVRSGAGAGDWAGSATAFLVQKEASAPSGAPPTGVGLHLASNTGQLYHYTASTWSQITAYPSHFGFLPIQSASVTGAFTVDLGLGLSNGSFTRTLTGNATLGFSGWRVGDEHIASLLFVQDGTGGRTLDLSVVDEWPDGDGGTLTAPVMPTAAAAEMEITLWSRDEGVTIYGVRTR